MAQTFTGRKRVRKVFGHIREVGRMPNLIEVQKASYDQFLQVDAPKGGRPDEGLQSVFRSVFPISGLGSRKGVAASAKSRTSRSRISISTSPPR